MTPNRSVRVSAAWPALRHWRRPVTPLLVLKQHYVAGGFTQSSSRLSLGCGSISARWALRARPTQVPIGVFSDFPEAEPLNSNRGSGADHAAALTQASRDSSLWALTPSPLKQ